MSEYETFIILDLEATCQENDPDFDKEIIEIGAVKVDKNLKIIDTFNSFITPKRNPKLSKFCRELTTIRQLDINRAEPFDVVIREFIDWIGNDYLLCSWGFYDKNQFINDCEMYDLPTEWVNKHISLKHQFAKLYNLRKPCGMAKALKMLNISLKGTQHRGIDDALNITEIFKKLYDKWEY